MTVFYVTLVTTYIYALLARISHDKKYRHFAFFWLTIVAMILIMVSGLRYGIGDTGAYKHSYSLIVSNPSSVKLQGDFALNLLSLVLINISTNPQILIFTVALITNMVNVICFHKYSSYLELQIYLYITSGYYLVTMNGIRQCLAASLLFLCTNYIIKGNFKKYIIVVTLISTIHGSALIMIPIYFIVRQEAWSKKILKLIALSVIGVLLYDIISPILFKLLEGTNYGHYSELNEGGSSFIRTIVNAVPVVLAYVKRDELKTVWPESNVFVNLAVINLVFTSFGMTNWIFNRFTLYFQLYNFILIPFLIKNCFKGKEKRLLYLGVLICYFIFFYREQVIGLNIEYKSDYINYNNIFYRVGD